MFFEYNFAAASISNNFSPGTLFSRRFLIKLCMSAKKCTSLNLSLIGCFGQKASKSRTNPGKMILSRTATVFSLDALSGLSCLSESLASFPCSLGSELSTWLQTRLRKTKITEGNRWLSKFLRKTFRLVTRFGHIYDACQLLWKFATLAILVENYASLDPKQHLFSEHDISRNLVISGLKQFLRKFILHLLLSYLHTLFS